MSDLFVLLASAGGIVLAIVVAHGAWQARKASNMKRAEPRSAPAEGLVEPMFDGAAKDVDQTLATEPGLEDPQQPLEGPVAGAAGIPAARAKALKIQYGGLDALIDAIVTISVDLPVPGEQVIAALPGTRRAGTKPMFFEGLDVEEGRWETPRPGRQYRELQAGVQLANRTGALNEIEFSEFIVKVQAFADLLNGSLSAPDMLETVARARELDAFANDHDAQISVHLVAARTAWSPAYLSQQAAVFGFVPGSIPGRLIVPSSDIGAPPVLVLQYDVQAAMAEDPDMTPVRQLTMIFDVPQTARSEEPFARLRDTALNLSRKIDATVMDDQGMRLGEEAFEAIGEMLGKLYDQLQARDLAAGSAAARRLFS